MPRIVPLQLLRCLKVLLDDNGGILSAAEVKRIAGLMTKYSKKLVSKCIYVQILKCTKTELLGEFMGVGGWTLVYTWLNDAIRAMNWPLVQEILELLLLSPVDVLRLKINSAPKLVKGLCKDGGNEGVRILARRLVEQWLKVVTENTVAIPQAITNGSVASVAANQNQIIVANNTTVSATSKKINKESQQMSSEQDPLYSDPLDHRMANRSENYSMTPAQKKANDAGLVFKFVVKDGQSVLAKVPKHLVDKEREESFEDGSNNEADKIGGKYSFESVDMRGDEENVSQVTKTGQKQGTEDSSSEDKEPKENESSGGEEEPIKHMKSTSNDDKKKSINEARKSTDDDKARSEKNERKNSRDSKDGKERRSEKDKDRKLSSSSYKSSSSANHKSSSSSSKSNTSSSSTSSKSKSSSVSSSAHRSSSDKHRSDKERSSSSKDKERKEDSKHKSSSSSSKSSSSSNRERHRDKDKEKLNTSASTSTSISNKKDKEREKEMQIQKDKDTLAKMVPPLLDKLGKIPRKPKDDTEDDATKASTSITIPSKKASMSIEIRRDNDKTKTVKTYKSQFRSHGLDEEAPPPPSRKSLKKPNASQPAPGTILPTSLPSSLKRVSPIPHDSPSDKKAKIELSNSKLPSTEKIGAIKLIPPQKKIQTLIETNIFSDALSAATGPKKTAKRKRPTTPALGQSKEGPSPPESPVSPKVAPLKFYQDTLNESNTDEKSDLDTTRESVDLNASIDNLTEDDDDIPLKKVKEDIELKVLKEQKCTKGDSIDITSDNDDDTTADDENSVKEPKKPGPGCGPDGPPGVLMLHRRKGPKKKLTWRTQDQLEQIRYFEVDETERVNVTKASSFMDMKNMERFSERDAINMSRRGFNHEDNMEPQTTWGSLYFIEDVPCHPDGHQSKQRKVQSDREMTTLRALYFSSSMIPDSPAEAELEPHLPHDIPVIPLDDITGNPDAVNDFTSMPWPEPKGNSKNDSTVGSVNPVGESNEAFVDRLIVSGVAGNQFNPFMSPYGAAQQNGPMPTQMQLSMLGGRMQPQSGWQGPPPNNMVGPDGGPMMRNPFNTNNAPDSPNIDIVMPQNFINPNGQFGPGVPFAQVSQPFGPNFNGPNFGVMGPNNGPMINGMPPQMMNGMPQRNNNNNNNNNNINKNRMHNNNNGGGNWRSGGGNYNDNGGDSRDRGGNWRSAGSGHGRGSGNNNNTNTGICKTFMRGHCRLGKNCKYIHPKNNKRL